MAQNNLSAVEDIDAIMAEMEAKTPKPADKEKSFDQFSNGNEIKEQAESASPPLKLLKMLDEDKVILTVPDVVDAKGFWTTPPKLLKPGAFYPSKPTNERYYDFTHSNVGAALIFNQMKVKGETERKGSRKDAVDLENVLAEIGFEVKVCDDYSIREIRAELDSLSQRDHSDNDCLFVCIMTHGKQDGKVFAADGEFMVQDLWENFVGSKCKSLIGKPKLFFIQACRGSMTDPGILYKPKAKMRMNLSDAVDAKSMKEPDYFVIPALADLLVMYSTAEGYYSFRNPENGSWFIQALCDELRENSHEDLFVILTGVNRRVAFAKQSNVPHNDDFDAMKQMPNIVSMLTKTMYFKRKTVMQREDS